MLLIDSSVWIEWLSNSALAEPLAPLFPEKAETMVPTIVQLEVSKWLVREVSERSAELFVGYTQLCAVIPLTTAIAVRAAEICRLHKLATADAVIYATALENDADLLTCDAHFQGLDGVIYIPKNS